MALIDDLLDDYLPRCAVELFESYGVPLVLEPARESVRNEVAGMIGFGGEHAKGSLVLASTFRVIGASFPQTASIDLGGPQKNALIDWTGELANQLIGRIKNRLLLHGVDFVLSTPVSLSGDDLAHSQKSRANQHRAVLRAPLGSLDLCLEARFAPGLEVRAEPMSVTDSQVASEGEFLLF